MPGSSVPQFLGFRRSPAAVAALTLVSLAAVTGLASLLGFARTPTGRPRLVVAQPSVVIVKSDRRLHLFDGDRLVRSYPVDLGLSPVGQKEFVADNRTPVGSFRVVTKNWESRYHRFIGLNYPDETAVVRGLEAGLISPGEAEQITDAHRRRERPTWSTALGGGVGLHGGRRGVDWTGGCVALSDRDIEELFEVLRLGDPVEILP